MKLEYFQTLIEAASSGSFSRAAEKLFVTQSAVSRRIQFLEEHYGYTLLDRSGPVLVTTEVGRIVLDKAYKLLAVERELQQALHDYKHKPGITFCCTPGFGMAFLPDIMRRFMLLHSCTSEMNFSFEFPDKVIEGLKSGIYQAGIIEHPDRCDLGGFETFPLPDDEFVFISSPALGLEGDNIDMEKLLIRDLYIRKEGSCAHRLLGENMKLIGRNCSEFARTIVCDDLHLIINTVLSGGGISFMPRSLVKQHLQQGTLREHRIAGFNHTVHRTLIVNRNAPPNQLLDDFINEVLTVFGVSRKAG